MFEIVLILAYFGDTKVQLEYSLFIGPLAGGWREAAMAGVSGWSYRSKNVLEPVDSSSHARIINISLRK